MSAERGGVGMRRALFIGVNDYGFAPLTSCVNDAVAMRDAVVELGLFAADECTVMTAPAQPGGVLPTRQAILDWLLAVYDAAPIDRLLVFFAGHGLSVRLGRAADELRMVLVPAGVDRLRQIGDRLIDLDELVGRFARFGAREQFWIVDACRNLLDAGVPTPNVAPIAWDVPVGDGEEMAQGVLHAVAPLGRARAVPGGHGLVTQCVLDGLRLAGPARWGGAADYDEAVDGWRVDLASLGEYATAQIGQAFAPGDWEREFQLPRVWTGALAPGALRVVEQIAHRPFVLRVSPPEAAGAVMAELSVRRNPVAVWPPRQLGEAIELLPERYRLSAGLAAGSEGWTLLPLAERVVDLRLRDEVVLRAVPAGRATPGGPATELGAPPPMPVSVLYPHHRQLSPRVRVFVDWVVERMGRGHEAPQSTLLTRDLTQGVAQSKGH